MKVERAVAGLFGVQVHFPGLAERVGLDKVPLVMHVEAVVDRVVFQFGYVPGHIDHSHHHNASGGRANWPGEGGALTPPEPASSSSSAAGQVRHSKSKWNYRRRDAAGSWGFVN